MAKLGLKRAGFGPEQRRNIENALRIALDRSATMEEILRRVRAECAQDDAVRHLVDFIGKSDRGVARG